ncbi:hypothetical protein JD844_025571 [Phrynosoma platyrhinos]|uniref:Adipocyte plasma membrane-associated protein n=1 Tax=Phrynosoma platyrhinos TaxID=52577 RepID=A0ABQ7SZM1_PHRPL|nr:hypothetical protein JD844_025571 [Phrynosoma platyrhinos]
MNEAEGLRQRRPLRPQVVTEDNTAQETKSGSTYSNKVFRVTFMTLAVSLIIPLFGAIILLDCPIDPQPISFKEPPVLTGPLEPNFKLRQAERLFENQLVGPESIANIGEILFTGTADGKILKIENGEIHTLARLGHGPCSKSKQLIYCCYCDDNYTLILLEYDTVTKEVKVLMGGLRFANGVQLSPSEDFVLVAETTMARIRRYYVSGLMKGGEDMFVENMPGFPDNIRLSSSGGYWVAMSAIRANPGFSMMDFLSEKPWIKRIIFKLLNQETVIKFVPKYSLVVELSDTGSYRRSFHDPNGMVATYISEAHEHNGHLYLGSFRSPFICRLNLEDV